MTWRSLLPGLLVAALPALSASGSPSEILAIREEASWLEQRIELPEQDAGGEPAMTPRQTLRELRRRLRDRGVHEPLVDALLPEGRLVFGRRGEDPAELRRAGRSLLAFVEAAERDAPETPPDARAVLEEVLEDPVFDVDPSEVGFVERQLRRVREFFGNLVMTLFTFATSHGVLMIWLTCLVTVLALLFFIVKFIVPLFGGRPHRAPAGYTTPETRATSARNPGDLLRRAREGLESGRFVAAVKLLEEAAILSLQQRGLLPERPGLTDLESLDLLRRDEASPLRSDFAELAGLHEEIVYAGRPATRAAASKAAEIAARIVSQPLEEPA